MIRVLFLGDIVGRPGRKLVIDRVAKIRSERSIDIVVANGENSAGGAGITAPIARSLHEAGVDVVTLGDHAWDQRGWDDDIDGLDWVCRPANMPAQAPGRRWVIAHRDGFRLGVATVLGRQFLNVKSACPFDTSDEILSTLADQTDGVLVEIHAEATSEKIALGWYLDGRASAVVGTHTHVPTADARVLPRGTGYLTDAGMSGPYTSVLGREIQPIVARFIDGLPRRCPVAEEDIRLSGCIFDIDEVSGACESVAPFSMRQ